MDSTILLWLLIAIFLLGNTVFFTIIYPRMLKRHREHMRKEWERHLEELRNLKNWREGE